MILITIVNGIYKPTNITGKPHDLNGKNPWFPVKIFPLKTNPLKLAIQSGDMIYVFLYSIPGSYWRPSFYGPKYVCRSPNVLPFLVGGGPTKKGSIQFGDLTNKNRIQLTIVENQWGLGISKAQTGMTLPIRSDKNLFRWWIKPA